MRDNALASRPQHLVCPVCETGELEVHGHVAGKCDWCGCVVNKAAIETLWQLIDLPDALGSHACDCGHPEMRRSPDTVLQCPACGDKIYPSGPRFSGDHEG